MKIEKLNENQVKFILSRDDLEQWNIKLTELTQGTERSYEFFHEMMEQASVQCDFRVDNMPLLIEAIPHSVDGMIIIVTKVTNSNEIDERFTLPPISKLFERFRSKSVSDAKPEPASEEKPEPISVFSFDSIDDVTSACTRLIESYWGQSALYKKDGHYFLLLTHEQNTSRMSQTDIESVLSEYGQRQHASAYSSYYLSEHAETIIERSAVGIMARL